MREQTHAHTHIYDTVHPLKTLYLLRYTTPSQRDHTLYHTPHTHTDTTPNHTQYPLSNTTLCIIHYTLYDTFHPLRHPLQPLRHLLHPPRHTATPTTPPTTSTTPTTPSTTHNTLQGKQSKRCQDTSGPLLRAQYYQGGDPTHLTFTLHLALMTPPPGGRGGAANQVQDTLSFFPHLNECLPDITSLKLTLTEITNRPLNTGCSQISQNIIIGIIISTQRLKIIVFS